MSEVQYERSGSVSLSGVAFTVRGVERLLEEARRLGVTGDERLSFRQSDKHVFPTHVRVAVPVDFHAAASSE